MRKEITKSLADMLGQHLNPSDDPRIYIASEVTFNYGSSDQCRVDYMRFKPLNNSISGIERDAAAFSYF